MSELGLRDIDLSTPEGAEIYWASQDGQALYADARDIALQYASVGMPMTITGIIEEIRLGRRRKELRQRRRALRDPNFAGRHADGFSGNSDAWEGGYVINDHVKSSLARKLMSEEIPLDGKFATRAGRKIGAAFGDLAPQSLADIKLGQPAATPNIRSERMVRMVLSRNWDDDSEGEVVYLPASDWRAKEYEAGLAQRTASNASRATTHRSATEKRKSAQQGALTRHQNAQAAYVAEVQRKQAAHQW